MSEESSQNNNREREEDEIGSEMEDGLFDEDLSVLEEIISPNSSTTPKKWKSRKYGELFEQISSKRLKCKLCFIMMNRTPLADRTNRNGEIP